MNETNKPGDTMSGDTMSVALRTHHFVQATKEKLSVFISLKKN